MAFSLAALSLPLFVVPAQVQTRLHRAMPRGKVTSREAKAALESAGRMANVFRDAGEISVVR